MREKKSPLYSECDELHRFCADRIGKVNGDRVTLRLIAVQTVHNDDGKKMDVFQAVYNDGTRLHIFRVSENALPVGAKSDKETRRAQVRAFCLLANVAQPLVYAMR